MDISVFEIIGPVMVGPSSSGTAGMARLGWAAGRFLDGPVKAIDLGFHPMAVLVLEDHLFMNDNNYNYSAVAVDGLSFVTENPLKISGNGFYVYHDASSSARKGTNLSGFSYLYLAVR